jgi:DNA-binding beta-propeller fold protein YncE
LVQSNNARRHMIRIGLAAVLACASLLAACTAQVGLPADDSKVARYPIALAASPAGDHLYVLGANFDRSFRSGVLRVVTTQDDTYVPGVQLEVPGFGSSLALQLTGDVTPTVQRIFVTAREDDSLTTVDVTGPTQLGCGKPDENGRCDSAHRLANADTYPLGNDPLDAHLAVGPDGRLLMHVVATSDGKVTILDLSGAATGTTAGVPHEVDSLNLGAGLSASATSPWTGRTYVSDTRAPSLHVYRMEATGDAASPLRAVREPSIALPSAGVTDFGRDVVLSSDGAKAYVALRSPNSVVVVDIAPTRQGPARNVVVDVLGVGAQPAQLAVAPVGPEGRDLVFVSCYGEDTVWVLDPALRSTVAVIPFDYAPYALTTVNVPGHGWQLYAALFNHHDIAVVPIGPSSVGRFTAIHNVKAP